jgi:type VI secretion system protein ImpA
MPTDPSPLCEPLSPGAPCGVDLEDTQLLASFDAFRIFGRDTLLSPEVDWSEIRRHSLDALAQSRDLRVLVHLAAATLRLEGIASFCGVLAVADRWVAEQWDLVFPRVADDALLRKNALSCLSDPMAIVAHFRRAAMVTHRQFGSVTLRDIDLTTGQPDSLEEQQVAPDPRRIEAALAATPGAELEALVSVLSGGVNSLDDIVANMQQRAGQQFTPDFAALAKSLMRMRKVLAEHLATRVRTNSTSQETYVHVPGPPPVEDPMSVTEAYMGAYTGTDTGEIKSRQEAIRAIDAAVLFFRKYEPSSPVPILLERARRLVAKGFMEVLEDIAPDGLAQARIIGGIRGDAE